MKGKDGVFQGHNHTELFYRKYHPEIDPKAVVIVVHGHGDHSGGLQGIYEKLLGQGYAVYAYDLRGHGKSSGKQGFIRSWQEYREDLNQFRKLVDSENPSLPLYMIGHSLGGVIAIDYSVHYGDGLAGLIAIAPAISYEATRSEKLLIKIMGRLKPDYTIEKDSDLNQLTKDKAVQLALKSDRLRHNKVTPGLGRGLLQVIPAIMRKAPSINLPFLLQYGLEDDITPSPLLRRFFDLLGSDKKQKYEYPHGRHRPFDDHEKDQFLDDLIGWLDMFN